jgi:hypothetical protein
LDQEGLLDIDFAKVGVIRTNSKYSFPCDNSLIRAEKHLIGGRRIGASLVVKDNLVFGIKERHDTFTLKGGPEEDDVLRNREAWGTVDQRCDFWLEFENGIKLSIEMQDKQHIHMGDVPLQEPEKGDGGFGDLVDKANAEGAEDDVQNQYAQKEATAAEEGTANTQGDISPATQAAQQRVMSAQSRTRGITQDSYEPTKGSKLSFTFPDGLLVQILPNGDVLQ